MPCQDQGYDASCFQPEFTTFINRGTPSQCQQPRMMPCEPCPQLCYDPCPQPRCDPCQPLGPQQMPCDDSCPPNFLCPPPCSPMCSPYRRLRYVQPPRRESCKPIVRYQRPSIPMTSDTVNKTSFDFIDAETAKSCRMPPVMPVGQLRLPCGEFAKETVTQVKFLSKLFRSIQSWKSLSALFPTNLSSRTRKANLPELPITARLWTHARFNHPEARFRSQVPVQASEVCTA